MSQRRGRKVHHLRRRKKVEQDDRSKAWQTDSSGGGTVVQEGFTRSEGLSGIIMTSESFPNSALNDVMKVSEQELQSAIHMLRRPEHISH